jgi:hypothetical protein
LSDTEKVLAREASLVLPAPSVAVAVTVCGPVPNGEARVMLQVPVALATPEPTST